MGEELKAVMQVFEEACSWEKDGEVVLRCEEKTGRVFFSGGQIAWARVSTIDRTFTAYLTEHSSVTPEEVKAVYEECEQAGTNLAETIVEWGLLDEATTRRLLLEHISECLFEIFSWPSVKSMFMPDDRYYERGLTFEFFEILQIVYLMNDNDKTPLAELKLAERDCAEARTETKLAPLDHLGTQRPKRSPENRIATKPAAQPALGQGPTNIRGEVYQETSPFGDEFETTQAPGGNEEDEWPPPETNRKGLFLVLGLAVSSLIVIIMAFVFGGKTVTPDSLTPESVKPVPILSTDAGTVAATAQKGLDAGHAKENEDAGLVESGDKETTEDGGDGDDSGDGDDGEARVEGADEKPEPEPEPEGIIYGAKGQGTCRIRVNSSPRRAKVYLDGVYTGRKTKTILKGVAAGREHMVMVESSRRRPVYKIVRCIDKKTHRVKVYPQRLAKKGIKNWRGWVPVRFESEPPGASIYVNGRRKGKTPTTIKLKASRKSKVELRRKGYRKFRRQMRPTPKEKLTIRVKLKKR